MIYFHRKGQIRFKPLQAENLAIDGWVKYMKTKLELLGLGNLMGNIYKVITGEISKEKYQSKHFFFQKQGTNCYIQNQFYNYIDNEDNRSFFTKLKQTSERNESEEF